MNLRMCVLCQTFLISSFLFTGMCFPSMALEPGSREASELIRSNYRPGEITSLCQEAISRSAQRLKAVARLKPAGKPDASPLLAYEEVKADFDDQVQPLIFMAYVATDESLRKEGSACEEEVGKFVVDIRSRRDLYEGIKNSFPGNPQEKRLQTMLLKEFERNGLGLEDAKLQKVKELKQRLAVLESQFAAHLAGDVSTVAFDKDELEGVPEDVVRGFKASANGKLLATTKFTDYNRVMQTAVKDETRRRMLLAYQNRAAEKNVKLLEEAIAVRQEVAELVGDKSWAEHRTRGRMAQNPETVLKFLNDLKAKLADRNRGDLAALLRYKKEMDPTAVRIQAWDMLFLECQLKKRNYDLDEEKIRQYFPASVVIQGLLEVYSSLLGVKYAEVAGADTWAPDVKLYRITDARDGRIIGYFYTDFFPREGKYEHAGAFPLISGRILSDGSYSHPIASIVANFTPPSDGKPSLLSHREVEIVFHEFGHIMHQTLTRAPYASLSGSNVAQDWVEAPSQMLENWVWSPEILKLISGHYLNPAEKLPDQLLVKMLEARDFNKGVFYTRQLHFALLDMAYHTSSGPVDTTRLFERLHREITGVEAIPGGHFQAGFGHLMGGYDAAYYGYLWSDVYAADMFTRFQSAGMLDPKAGADYRRIILEKGNMVDGQELLKEFLGRDLSSEAFFQKLQFGN